MLQSPTRLHSVQVPIDIDLEQHPRVVRRPARRLRIHPLKAHLPQVQLLDEGLDHPGRVVLRHVVLDTLGQQTDLSSVRALDKSLHRASSASRDAVFYSVWLASTIRFS